jgi:hypothetical protein
MMMKKYSSILMLAAVIIGTLASCKKDESTGTMVIHYKAVYDGQPLKTFQTFPFENGQQIQFSHLSMFISDLSLTKSSGQESLDDVELVDLSFDDATAAANGYTQTIMDIPAGTYSGLSFGVGVPQDVNAMKPADFPSSNPLSKTGYYWSAWQSYIFSKTEGRLDTLGSGNLELGFAIHTGADSLYTSLQAPVTLVVEDGKETVIEIVIDYKLLLEGVDIKNHPQNHSPTDMVAILALTANIPDAFTLYH